MHILTSKKVEPLLNRIGKPMPLSDVTYTSKGRMMIKRPKKDVLNNVVRRTTSCEDVMQINFKCMPDTPTG